MLAVLFGIKCKKKCSRSKIMPKKVLALSVRAYVQGEEPMGKVASISIKSWIQPFHE